MRSIGWCTGTWLLLSATAATAAEPGIEFFEKKIRPVLVKECYSCHAVSAKKPKGGLLLDSKAALLKGGDSGPALVPGKPSESLLLKAVRYTDPNLRMPPKTKLSDGVIADFEKWIAMGAPDPRGDTATTAATKVMDIEAGRKFWAYQPPRRHAVPTVKDVTWPRGGIDRFLLAKLENKGLKPAADADRLTLLRRLSYDLIGLPPTPEEIDAWLGDKSANAYERLVDRLLGSPHFGERWGRHWLDVARFAESSGGGRSLMFKDAWRYRDYVIDAFNSDKPYDEFVMEQIAGDLLPYSTPEQRRRQVIATAFLVLGPTNYEEQDKDVLEMDVVDEQLDTMGRAFLGMTIGCARCHDHKFDPIPTRDYYALAGIMHSTHTLIHDNVSRWVDVPLPLNAEQEAALKKHEAAVAELKKKIQLAKEAEKGTASVAAKGVIKPSDLPGIVLDDAQAKKVGDWTKSQYSGNYIGDGYLHDGNTGKGEKTLTFVPEFPSAGKYEVRLAYVPASNRSAKVPVHILHLDGEFTGHVNEQETPPIDGRFVSLGTFRFDKSGQWYVIVSNEGTAGHVVVDAVQFIPEEMKDAGKAASKPAETAKPNPLASSKALESELKKLQDKGPQRPLAMGVEDVAKVHDAFVCIRGNIHNRGDKVPRGFLQVLSPEGTLQPTLPTKESGRRELAAWLARADNPLTARVMVNRIWHHLFGAGIVRSVDTFGTTGELPSHPELLDHLALRFIDEGWSVKKLIRTLVLTRAYQMSSNPRAVANASGSVDPENRLLAHANRRRLDAESLRDTILTVSGRLDRTVGGPNMRPGTASETGYQFDDGRRSVYTPVFRNRLLELFEAFDFADPNLSLGRRNVSTVATQALYLMNSPFVMEEAKEAAQAALKSDLDDGKRVERAYRTALGRPPSERERELALKFVTADSAPEKRLAAWSRFYQSLFACIDFRYVN
jgi:hypothetical protein